MTKLQKRTPCLHQPKSGSRQASFEVLANQGKCWRDGADPRGHRHLVAHGRVIGCAWTRPLASALGSARIGQPSTLSDNRWSRCQVSQSSRNRPGLKRFEDKCRAREGRASLSTRSLVVVSSATPSLAYPSDNAHTLDQDTAHADQAQIAREKHWHRQGAREATSRAQRTQRVHANAPSAITRQARTFTLRHCVDASHHWLRQSDRAMDRAHATHTTERCAVRATC